METGDRARHPTASVIHKHPGLNPVLFWMISSLSALAQIQPMTLEQLSIEAREAATGTEIQSVVQKAFDSNRPEWVLACFPSVGMSNLFLRALRDLPNSDFKNQIILGILSLPWPYDSGIGSRPAPILGGICIDTLKIHLPNEGLNADETSSIVRFSNLGARKILAKQFQEALDQSKSSRGPRPERRPSVGEVQSQSGANSPATSRKVDPISGAEKKPASPFKWVPLLFAIAYGLGFFAWRIARMKSAGSQPF